ncbi:MAG: DNA repair protein RecO [Bacteroidales bacterium]|jgi:DNA repair protein RecO (recombination protein O)|nr:DNA repair protein RecO [Bacteroidales bacterium]
MLIRTKAVVLNQFRYSDNSTIAHVLTQSHGKLSLFVRGSTKGKTNGKQRYFQPLFLLDADLEYKEKREIQNIKEIRISDPLQNISSDIRKQSVAIFLAEALSKSIHPEQPDDALFDFVFHNVLLFEHLNKGSNLFHHYFLVQLMKYLGFSPGNKLTESMPFLDTESGLFVPASQLTTACFNETESKLLAAFTDINADLLPNLNMTREKKQIALESILFYYSKHVPGFDKLKSYNILKGVFSGNTD